MTAWLKLGRKSQPLPEPEPPIALGNRSNGEYYHQQTAYERRLRALILDKADEWGRRVGLDRREFLASTMGMATSLWAINACGGSGSGTGGGTGTGDGSSGGPGSGSGGTSGGSFDTGSGGPLDSSDSSGGPCTPLEGEFIFDVQTHHVNPDGDWRETNPTWEGFFGGLPQAGCGLEAIECLSAQQYIEQMFLNSDTTVAVLSGLPALACGPGVTGDCGNPLTNQEIADSRELINALANSQRSVNHCMVTPNVNLQEQLDLMQMVHEELGVGGWKCYPPWGPTGTGWFLDDADSGLPFIQHGLDLGVDVFCAHKGLAIGAFDQVHTDPRDAGVVAAMFPTAKFVMYHSAWLHGGLGNGEGPYDPLGMYDPANPTTYPVDQGVNSLIKSVEDAGLGVGSNVYAELGSTWGNLMLDPTQAAHVLGKLLKHLGPDNVLWGTDAIWTGSPQPQIEAFRAFQISTEFQETYGYPELTDEIKLKILGRNAAAVFGIDADAMRCEIDADDIGQGRRYLDGEYGKRRWVFNKAPGPRTRREFMNFTRMHEGP